MKTREARFVKPLRPARSQAERQPELTVIIPVHNEEDNVVALCARLAGVIDGLGMTREVIFIDDGSTDRSLPLLHDIAETDPGIRILSFSRNFGHQAAISAGLDHASGRAVVIMDGDLQHPPEVLPALIEKWREGYDVVYTTRTYSSGANAFKRITSRLFYRLISRLAGFRMPDGAADFRLLDRKVVDVLKGLKERTRFMRGLSVWAGFRQTGIDYAASERNGGQSKYSLRRMVLLALDGVTSFSVFPLRMAVYLGFLISFVCLLYLVYVLYVRFVSGTAIPGWASTIIAVLFIGSVQLITVGILGEYIGRIYEELKGRPTYIVREKVGFEDREHDTH